MSKYLINIARSLRIIDSWCKDWVCRVANRKPHHVKQLKQTSRTRPRARARGAGTSPLAVQKKEREKGRAGGRERERELKRGGQPLSPEPWRKKEVKRRRERRARARGRGTGSRSRTASQPIVYSEYLVSCKISHLQLLLTCFSMAGQPGTPRSPGRERERERDVFCWLRCESKLLQEFRCIVKHSTCTEIESQRAAPSRPGRA